MSKLKLFIISAGVIVLILILFFVSFLGWFYYPFIKEMRTFKTQASNNKTKIINEYFNVEFEVNRNCYIDPRFMNYIGRRIGAFSGYLYCDDIEYPVNIGVNIYREIDFENYNNNTRFFGGQWRKNFRGGDLISLEIVDYNKEKILYISGNANNREIIEDILESIKEIKGLD